MKKRDIQTLHTKNMFLTHNPSLIFIQKLFHFMWSLPTACTQSIVQFEQFYLHDPNASNLLAPAVFISQYFFLDTFVVPTNYDLSYRIIFVVHSEGMSILKQGRTKRVAKMNIIAVLCGQNAWLAIRFLCIQWSLRSRNYLLCNGNEYLILTLDIFQLPLLQ